MPEPDRWAYLTSEPFRARQALAAHFTQYLDVLEIGGWNNPCGRTGVNVDPLADYGPRFVDREQMGIEEYLATEAGPKWIDGTHIQRIYTRYAVVALGLDLPEIGPLTASLLQGAQRVVVETADGYDRGEQAMAEIYDLLFDSHAVLAEIDLSISGPDIPVADGYPTYGDRRMTVWQRKVPADA